MTQVDPLQQYRDVMSVIASRFALIRTIEQAQTVGHREAEAIGFQLRKIVEGVAFGCLISVENGMKQVPREASGQWNADKILVALKKRGTAPLPNPNVQRPPTDKEVEQYPGIKYVMEGQPDKCVSIDGLREIYRRTHKWTHEQNPYLGYKIKESDIEELRTDVAAVFQMLNLHIIGINGESFWCNLKDASGEPIVVASASKVGELDRVEAVS